MEDPRTAESSGFLSTLTRRVLFAPLDDHGRADVVEARLRAAITLGVLAKDEQLPSENELAAQLNVSPVTLREALAQLRTSGLVVTKRGRHGGTVVSGDGGEQTRAASATPLALSSIDLRDLADWRRAIATEAARLAARRASAEELPVLQRGVANLATASDERTARRADSRYFIEIAAASQSVRLSEGMIRLQVEYAPVMTSAYRDPALRTAVAVVLDRLTTSVETAAPADAASHAAEAVDLVASRAADLIRQERLEHE